MRHRRPLAITVALLCVPTLALAVSPERRCQKARYGAAAKYAACELKTFGGTHGAGPLIPAHKTSKCRLKYVATWEKIRAAAATNSGCDTERFTIVDGTVRDHLTGLQWERKTDDGGIHDKDDGYSWSADWPSILADGTVFTSLLPTLNAAPCFAGHCDWRLPTRSELQTILLAEPQPCVTIPCIDQSVFGPTVEWQYWTSTPVATDPAQTWLVSFLWGHAGYDYTDNILPVRVVRGGL
jgi:hypothetical protein